MDERILFMFILYIVFSIIGISILYFVIRAAVKAGIDDSITNKMIGRILDKVSEKK
ncbi:hypothetical protein ACSVDA_15665 [Cytobacillus sp. Hm23]